MVGRLQVGEGRKSHRTNLLVIVVEVRSLGVGHAAHVLQVQGDRSRAGHAWARRVHVQQPEHSLHALGQDRGGVGGGQEARGARVAEVEDVQPQLGQLEGPLLVDGVRGVAIALLLVQHLLPVVYGVGTRVGGGFWPRGCGGGHGGLVGCQEEGSWVGHSRRSRRMTGHTGLYVVLRDVKGEEADG